MQIKLGERTIIVHQGPLDILEKFTQYQSRQPESGGIILGKLFNDRVEIFKLSVPTSLDRASRYNFERSKISAQVVLDYEFYNSNGQLIYLGEWHTHPEASPTPSSTDLNMIKNQFNFNDLNTDFLLLLIKGTEKVYFRLVTKSSFIEVCVKIAEN